mmetsp:Transcript_12909/g.34912  ORF Transcript_12909/g.34912 Transcript_12909/m.34912 type:complete len:108 (+) Transcript_12909:520-843(+)
MHRDIAQRSGAIKFLTRSPPHPWSPPNPTFVRSNSFSNEFSIQLIGVPIPRWINRLANWGSLFSTSSNTPPIEAEPEGQEADGDPRGKKKELTPQQRAMLAKIGKKT